MGRKSKTTSQLETDLKKHLAKAGYSNESELLKDRNLFRSLERKKRGQPLMPEEESEYQRLIPIAKVADSVKKLRSKINACSSVASSAASTILTAGTNSVIDSVSQTLAPLKTTKVSASIPARPSYADALKAKGPSARPPLINLTATLAPRPAPPSARLPLINLTATSAPRLAPMKTKVCICCYDKKPLHLPIPH